MVREKNKCSFPEEGFANVYFTHTNVGDNTTLLDIFLAEIYTICNIVQLRNVMR